MSLLSPVLQVDSLLLSHQGSPSWNVFPSNTFLGLCQSYYGGPKPWGSGFCSGGHHSCGHNLFGYAWGVGIFGRIQMQPTNNFCISGSRRVLPVCKPQVLFVFETHQPSPFLSLLIQKHVLPILGESFLFQIFARNSDFAFKFSSHKNWKAL